MSELRASRRTFSAPPQGVVSGIRQQTDAAPPALTTPAATPAALQAPAAYGAALATQLEMDVQEDLRWARGMHDLSAALGYDTEHGTHFI